MDSAAPPRLSVPKTYKLFIGGAFPRTESGRYLRAMDPSSGALLANYCHASRKDVREAVRAARSAWPGWAGASPLLRGQILYRLAEMLEGRADSMALELARSTGATDRAARREVTATVDRIVHFAGWADKLVQVFSRVNPVSSPHISFSVPEPSGVVGIVCPDEPPLLALATLLARAVVSGNTVVAIASDRFPLPSASLAECLATSDLPGGVVNLLTGRRDELAPVLADHMDVDAVLVGVDAPELVARARLGAAANLKRVAVHATPDPRDWLGDSVLDPRYLLDTLEIKTTWHPLGF